MIVVTGSTGRIGRCVRRSAARARLPILCQSRHAPPRGGFRWTPGSRNGEDAFAGATAILHLAGATPTAGEAPDENGFRAANVEVTLDVLDMAVRHGVPRVLLASSASVYGRPDAPVRVFDEAAPLRPLDAYGRSKAEMEAAALSRAARPGAPEVTILRIATVAGADQLFGNARMATPDDPLRLDRFASGGGPLRSYIGPASLGDALLALSAHPAPLPPVLNVALPSPVRMDALLRALESRQPVSWSWRPAPERAIERVVVDTGALERLHAFSQAEDSPAGIVAQVIDAWGAGGMTGGSDGSTPL